MSIKLYLPSLLVIVNCYSEMPPPQAHVFELLVPVSGVRFWEAREPFGHRAIAGRFLARSGA